jgi:hypothetical protein
MLQSIGPSIAGLCFVRVVLLFMRHAEALQRWPNERDGRQLNCGWIVEAREGFFLI